MLHIVREILNIQGGAKQKRFGKEAKPLETGGGKRDRTADLLHAMQALYQLSYTPVKLVANQGFEPRTQGL